MTTMTDIGDGIGLPLPQIRGANVITNSRLSCLKQCARKHYYRYELGIRRREQATALRMGSAFHLGLDFRGKGRMASDAAADAIEHYDVVPDWARTDEAFADWLIERETVYQLLVGYFWYWENATLPPELTVAEVIASEIAFDLPIRNPETGAKTASFRVAGKIDKIVKLGDGRLAVMEHKTTGDSIDVDSEYWKRLRIDQQISLYMHAAREMGYDVATVLYDVARKPGIAPKQVAILDGTGAKIVLDADNNRVFNKDGKPRQTGDSEKGWTLQSRIETADEFGQRLILDIGERPQFYYARREIPRLEADLDEFRWELWQQQQQLRDSQKHGRWFRNTTACVGFGTCEYIDVCGNGLPADGSVPSGFVQVQDIHPELLKGD